MARLKRTVGLAPERILAASDDALAAIVVGARPFERVARLRRCAELAIAGAQWRHYPGIGQPGVERIQLFTGQRGTLALDSNALRVLIRTGYGTPDPRYATEYRLAQLAASAELPDTVPDYQRAHQLLRRHGQTVCRRSRPLCSICPLAHQCPSAAGPPLHSS
jgi:adenine-specific DNA glycosylase